MSGVGYVPRVGLIYVVKLTASFARVLTKAQAAKLLRSINGKGECVLRGCTKGAKYFMRRPIRGGEVQPGLYCVEHDQIYGARVLQKLRARVRKAARNGAE